MAGFEWDEHKRHLTLAKHQIDFVDAAEIFSGPYVKLVGKSETEQRFIAIGQVQGYFIAVVSTEREDVIRIITARRARENERQAYSRYVAGRSEKDS